MTRKGAKQFSVASWQILGMQMGFDNRLTCVKKKNANSICVFCAALNADKCASGKTDLRCILADSTNANRV